MSTTNGGPAEAPAPQLSVLAQYVKDFSFENPHAPQLLLLGLLLVFGFLFFVDARPLAETDEEVSPRLEGKAEHQGNVMFAFELTFAGVFRIQNVPQDSLI